MQKLAACLLSAGLLGGCVSPMFQSDPAASYVQVTTNPEQIKGATLLATGYCELGALRPQMEEAMNYARNFTHQAGGDIAYIQTNTGFGGRYGSMLYVVVEAYRR